MSGVTSHIPVYGPRASLQMPAISVHDCIVCRSGCGLRWQTTGSPRKIESKLDIGVQTGTVG
jgi:hypothetical protein